MANNIIQLKNGEDNLFTIQPWENLTSSNDLDNVKRTTRAWCNDVANKPVANTYGWLEVMWADGSSSGIQKYYSFGSSGVVNIYMRCFANSRWYAWHGLTLT